MLLYSSSVLPPLLFLLLLLLLQPSQTRSSGDTYMTFDPAYYILSPGSIPIHQPPTSPSPLPSPPTTIPFSPAILPACLADTLSCDIIGEPSWCCTTTQRCAFDDVRDVACCPVGDFCRGVVGYGAGAGAGAGDTSTSSQGGDVQNHTAYQGSTTVETDTLDGANVFSGNQGSPGSLFVAVYSSQGTYGTLESLNRTGPTVALLIWVVVLVFWD